MIHLRSLAWRGFKRQGNEEAGPKSCSHTLSKQKQFPQCLSMLFVFSVFQNDTGLICSVSLLTLPNVMIRELNRKWKSKRQTQAPLYAETAEQTPCLQSLFSVCVRTVIFSNSKGFETNAVQQHHVIQTGNVIGAKTHWAKRPTAKCRIWTKASN